MDKIPRGQAEKGSRKWLQMLINEKPGILNELLRKNLNFSENEHIEWLSPLRKCDYAEYHDNSFLEKLGLDEKIPDLKGFWPSGGPRWDGLGRSSSGNVFLVEAKSHIQELISSSRAKQQDSIDIISKSLKKTKSELGSRTDFDWSKTFYQYANRLAYVHFLRKNGVPDTYFVSIYFLNDTEMKGPNTIDEWKGAIRLLHRCLGLQERRLKGLIIEFFIDIKNL